MATRIDNYPCAHPMQDCRHAYPYADWFDGSVIKLMKGEDFTCEASSMRINLYNYARKNGFKVRTCLGDYAQVLHHYRVTWLEITPGHWGWSFVTEDHEVWTPHSVTFESMTLEEYNYVKQQSRGADPWRMRDLAKQMPIATRQPVQWSH